jgi:quercetin dioxygenase-like cupin family protein
MNADLSPAAARAVVEAIRQQFSARHAMGTESPEILAELSNVLTLLDQVDFSRVDADCLKSSGHPVVRQLGALPATPEHDSAQATGALFATVRPHLDALPWRYSYEPRPDAPDIGTRMAWAELVGPIAPFRSTRVCLGLTAIGPHLRYPLHYHPAVETYLVLSGTAAWTAEERTRHLPPGTLILHPANLVHAMETADEPLLAAYAWSGAVEILSAYV